ncbi:MAG: response regulator, partial [Nitrospinae bacterium]|nr:response regulator [Nitrospinota bacterium]
MKIKVLLIEDDEDDVQLIKDMLSKSQSDIELEVARNSGEGIEKIKAQSFDCILTDYIVPPISGLEIMEEARKSNNKTPFIILTGFGDGGLGADLIKRGAAGFRTKDTLTA